VSRINSQVVLRTATLLLAGVLLVAELTGAKRGGWALIAFSAVLVVGVALALLLRARERHSRT
jgi:hypothetical protein